MKSLVSCVFALNLLVSTALPQKPTASVYNIPTANDGWKLANADSLGIDSKQLAELTTAIRAWPELGVHAIVIERDNKLIAQWQMERKTSNSSSMGRTINQTNISIQSRQKV